jgi:hypothetical protein
MDKKIMERLEDNFCEVLRDFAEKGFSRAEDVETAKAALSGMVKMKMLEEMENFRNGYSGRMYRDDGDMSNRRDSMGRYADNGGSYRGYRDDGYSGHDIKAKMRQKLQEMAMNANGEERRYIDEFMNKLN